MPLTVENSPELLNEEVDMATQRTQRVKVTRAFYQRSDIRGVGSVLDLPSSLATELRSANKVEFVQSDTKLNKSTAIKPPPDAKLPSKDAAGASAGKGA
jgi:hypothetical protein